jgi:hypothetical protein
MNITTINTLLEQPVQVLIAFCQVQMVLRTLRLVSLEERKIGSNGASLSANIQTEAGPNWSCHL